MTPTTGLRAELVVEDPPDCPVAQAVCEGAGRTVARTRNEPPVTEEVVVEQGEPPEGAEPVYEEDSSTVYRFERDTEGCACETVEGHGSPVLDAYVRDGDLHVVFHVRTREDLKEVLEDLSETYSVSVRRVTTAGDPGERELVHTDALTDRQREALETAHSMGYFEHPKGANATDVADEMGIAVSTFTEHLSAAQRKLLDGLL